MRASDPFSPSRRQTGALLPEVLAASGILAMGVLGLVLSQSRASMDLRAMHERLEARFLVMDLAEQSRAYHPAGLPAGRLAAWRAQVADRLPRGEARVDLPGPAGSIASVTVTWHDPDQGEPATLRTGFQP
jgi:Tfp pilus assembly protein PilV